MEYEIACGLYVKEKVKTKPLKLYPKHSSYKYSEQITVPVTQKTYKVTEDILAEKLKDCKSICQRPRTRTTPVLYSYNPHLLKSTTKEISVRTGSILNTLTTVTKNFSAMIVN